MNGLQLAAFRARHASRQAETPTSAPPAPRIETRQAGELARELAQLKRWAGVMENRVAALTTLVAELKDPPPDRPPAEQPEPLRGVVTINAVKKTVAESYGVTAAELESPRRDARIVRYRQIAMYLACALTKASLPQIGRHFGWRDHTTVLHARNKIAALRSGNDMIDLELRGLEAKIQDKIKA
jgi:hypothetical protein